MTDYYVNDGGSDTNPYETKAKAANALETIDAIGLSAGDRVFIDSTHIETTGPHTYTFAAGVWIITYKDADDSYESMVTGGGSISTTGSNDIFLDNGIWKGLHFNGADWIYLGGPNALVTCIDCRLQLSGNDNALFYGFDVGMDINLIDCELIAPDSAADNDNSLIDGLGDGSTLKMFGGSVSGQYKEAMIETTNAAYVELYGVDMSAYSSTASSSYLSQSAASEVRVKYIGCDLPDVTFTDPTPRPGGCVEIIQSDDSTVTTGRKRYRMERYHYLAKLVSNSATFKDTGGFSPPDSADKISWQITDKNLSGETQAFYTFPFGAFFNEDNTAQTASVEVLLHHASSITDIDSNDMGILIRSHASATTTKLQHDDMSSPAMGDPLTTPTAWAEAGTAGDGWTYGPASGVLKAFTLTDGFTSARDGMVEVVVWVRNIPAAHLLFVNPVATYT